MNHKIRYTAAVLSMLLLAGCANDKEDNAVSDVSTSETTTVTETSETVTTEAQTVCVTETVTETDTLPPETTAVTTTTVTTVTTVTTTVQTTPPVTTTTAATTPPPVTTPPPASGTTSNGHTLTVENGITYVDGVLVANKTYALPDSYNPGGLTGDTYAAFMEMQSAASAQGLSIFVKSGYRSYWDQRYIYNGYVARDGQAAADRYSARAGHSEHQSGMAIDVNSTSQSFADTPEGVWLKNNCHLYGFIIRYPEGKEGITGYMYEPWHVRYVGRDVAAKIKESGLCFEEYFGITSAYSY